MLVPGKVRTFTIREMLHLDISLIKNKGEACDDIYPVLVQYPFYLPLLSPIPSVRNLTTGWTLSSSVSSSWKRLTSRPFCSTMAGFGWRNGPSWTCTSSPRGWSQIQGFDGIWRICWNTWTKIKGRRLLLRPNAENKKTTNQSQIPHQTEKIATTDFKSKDIHLRVLVCV